MAEDVLFLGPDDFPKVPFVLDGVSYRFIKENKVIPLDLKNNTLKVVMADPSDREIIDSLRVAVGADIAVYTSDGVVIDEYISKFYGQEAQNIKGIIEDMDGEALEFIHDEEEDVGHLKDLALRGPDYQALQPLHFEGGGKQGERYSHRALRGRTEGEVPASTACSTTPRRPRSGLQAAIVSRIKIMSKMNIAERRLPQDGRIRLRVGEREIDLRVSTIPIVHGEGVVMRILDKESVVVDLDQLGFFPDTLAHFQRAYKETQRHRTGYRPHGKREDHHPLRRPGQGQCARQEDHHRGRPRGIPAQGREPDTGENPDRPSTSRIRSGT